MGTTLQGKKVKDTYKSIIKVSDNGEAGSTGKQLSDGDGNDLGIYVDTDGVLGVGAAASVAIDASSKTDAIQVPSGTTEQRPTAGNGMMRYNSTLGKMEYYDGAWKAFAEGDIESVVAGNGLTGGANDGDATVNVVGGTGITVTADEVKVSDSGIGTQQLSDNSVTYAKLEPRYTESGTLTDSSSITVDSSAKNIYTHTITQATTFNFTNAEIGQVLTLIITGDATNGITLGTINTNSATWNKISGDFDEANAAKNLIEIKFISGVEAWYQISQIAS